MKIFKVLFVVVMAVVAFLSITSTSLALPPCGYWQIEQNGSLTWHLYNRPAHYVNGVWVPADTEFNWWKNALCTHQVTLEQFNLACHPELLYPSLENPCYIAD